MPRSRRGHLLSTLASLSICACTGERVDPPDVGRSAAGLEDFSSGVVAVNHPAGAGVYGVWYDATDNTFGTPSAAMLAGAPAMRIDDGGFTNGVYAIFANAVPSDGRYRIEAPVLVVESSATTFDAIDRYEIGVAVGGAHRGPNPSALGGLPFAGSYAGLTDGDDSALPIQVVATAEFDAVAGDDLLVAFGTDVTSGAWNSGSGAWSGAYVLVGPISLVAVTPDPNVIVDDDDGPPAFVQTGPWATSSATGHAGGVYRTSSAGNAATAAWSAALAPGFYDVFVTYRAGTNRVADAAYEVVAGGDVLLSRTIDQRYRDLVWVKLGLVEVGTATTVTVRLDVSASGPTGVVVADAVRFSPSPGPPPVDPPEIRLAAITVFDDIDDVGAIQVTVDELAELHYNAIAVHARYRGDATYFPNRTDATYPNAEPQSPQAGNVDVLEELVTRGHRAGLRVFAYVNTHLVTDGADQVADPAHVVNVHADWRTWAYAGGTPVVQTTAHDPEGLWLEPALPPVQAYLADIAGDIASNYAIDGIILDRIRYPQTAFTRTNRDFGYHPDAVALFNLQHGTTGTPDPYDPAWIAFRQHAITRTVGLIANRLDDIDPNLLLLAYPIGRFSDAVVFNYQDWPRWLAEHRIDGVLPQIYTPNLVDLSARLDEHAQAYGGDRLLGVTLNAFTAGIDLEGQIELARASGFAGTSPFRHGTVVSLGYTSDLAAAWDGVAPFPATPWNGVSVAPIEVHGICAGASVTQTWNVDNPNASPLEIRGWTPNGAAIGPYFAPAGASTFATPSTPGPQLVVVTWHDHRGRLRATLGAAPGRVLCALFGG